MTMRYNGYRASITADIKRVDAEGVRVGVLAAKANPDVLATAQAAVQDTQAAYLIAMKAYDVAIEKALGSRWAEFYMEPTQRHTPELLALYEAAEKAGDAQSAAEMTLSDVLAAVVREAR